MNGLYSSVQICFYGMFQHITHFKGSINIVFINVEKVLIYMGLLISSTLFHRDLYVLFKKDYYLLLLAVYQKNLSKNYINVIQTKHGQNQNVLYVYFIQKIT